MNRITCILLLLFLAVSCNKKAAKIPGKQIRSVKCAKVYKSTTIPVINITGVTQPYKTVKLAFRISGVIDKLKVRLGDVVSKNQPIASLEATDFQLQLLQAQQLEQLAKSRLRKIKAKARDEELISAKARVKAAQQSYENAHRVYESQIKLTRSRITSEIELDKLRTRAQVAFEEVTMAKQNLILLEKGARIEEIQLASDEVEKAKIEVQIAKQNLEYLQINAPFGGTITSLPIEAKEYINSGKTAVVIDDLYKIKLEVFVPASQIAQISVDQKVDISIESFSEELPKGKVTYVASKAEEISKTFSVEMEIANLDLKIRSGMFSTARIYVGKPQHVILIPPQCLLEDVTGKFVLLLESLPNANKMAKVVRKDVTLGKLAKGFVEIKEIKEGDIVVMEGQHYVAAGDHVVVTEIREKK